jgi:hypothetical protein
LCYNNLSHEKDLIDTHSSSLAVLAEAILCSADYSCEEYAWEISSNKSSSICSA